MEPGACVSSGCPDGEICDPVGGGCSEDPCLRTHCPYGETCNSETSQCELRCFGGLIFCGEEDNCVNPQTSREHCGARRDCQGENAGTTCADGLVCSRGECSDSCADNLVNCGGECVDGQSDSSHCGASNDCRGDDEGEQCRTGFTCTEGRCVSITGGGGGPGGGPGSGDDAEDATRVIASGGGGCTCSTLGGSARAHAPSRRGPLAMLLLALALAWLGRRRAAWALSARKLGPAVLIALAVLSSTLFSAGCKVDTFCLDCDTAIDPVNPDADGGGGGSGSGGDSGGVIPVVDSGTSTDAQTAADTGAPRPDGGCTDHELCNGLDDDCDDTVDEGADPAELSIDINTNVNHCGGCGQACALVHAFNECVDAQCRIDRDQGVAGCDVGYVDLDASDENGCEYRCTKSADDDSECDLVDDDCDGEVDEDVALATDTDNCGSCGFTCRFANAVDGSTCVAGACVLDDTMCDPGFKNLDGVQGNGCERRCSRFPTTPEECNLEDDDCDGTIDEDVATTDPMVGEPCGTDAGECQAGTTVCVGGAVSCPDDVEPDTEECDGDDNDCDGLTDESDPVLASNPACGSSIGVCERGVLQCVGGTRVCGGSNFVGPAAAETCNRLDDDCDGPIDEDVMIDDEGTPRALADGVACSMRTGMLVITPEPADAPGACAYGTLACQSGQLACQGEILPSTEKCDNVDRDCDGAPVPANLATLNDDRLGVVCSNQLGICGNGTPGRTVCVNAGTAGSPNWQVQCSAGSVTPEAFESCDGQDDDCDGRFDENAAGTGSDNCHLLDDNDDGVFETYVAGPLETGECSSGDTFCTGGSLACIGFVGPRPETCNGLDDDCNGLIDDEPQFESTPCNVLSGTIGSSDTWNLFGVCSAGTWTCPAVPATAAMTGLQCIGGTRPAASETCNALDDDCDGDVDEQWVAMGAQPQPGTSCCPNDVSTPHVDVCNAAGAAFAACRPGTNQCAGGQVSCIQTSWDPAAEVCDLGGTQLDNDCDGAIDEGYRTGMGVYSNIDNCGGCGPAFDCRAPGNQVDDAIMACIAGQCEIVTCDGGHFDDPNIMGEDCDLFCPFFAGDLELCDGEDNDCDGLADEAPDLQGPVAATFCDTDGACAGAVPECTDIGGGEKGWTCSSMPATADTCTFDAGSPGVSNVDEDCDGRVDEGVTLKAGFTAGAQGVGVGRSCLGPGNGVCRPTGVQVCDSTNTTRTKCVVSLADMTEVTTNTAARSNEVCDGEDDDCDGQIDEPCSDAGGLCMPNDSACITANTSGGVLGCVIDSWAQLDSDTWLYAYEASRPNAGPSTQGTASDRACSGTNRMPWTSISYEEAVDACEAAGARLCSRTEWRQACSCGGTGTTGSALFYDYGWPSSGACTTNNATAATQCNIADSANTIDATGAAANSDCRITHNTAGVYDLSGNVKELTLAQDSTASACDPSAGGSCRIQVRGGASSNTAAGAACGYDRSYWPDDAPFYNVGFRCCFGPDPRLEDKGCMTFNSMGTPTTVMNGADLLSNLVVSGSEITVLTSVGVTLAGSGGDADDLSARLVQGGTDRLLVDLAPCSNNQTLNLSVSFSDSAASLPTVSGACTNLTGGGTYRPANALSAFNGTAADATWQLQLLDNDAGDSTTLTSWSLQVCGYGPP